MFNGSIVKHAPTSQVVTPTGGSTHTLALHRYGVNGLGQPDPNSNTFVYAEDTTNAVKRGTVAATVVKPPREVVVAGLPSTVPGQSRLVMREWYQNSTTGIWYPLDFNVLVTVDQISVPAANIQQSTNKMVQLLGSAAYLDFITRGSIT